ncbi:hypothetical protein [Dyella sp. 333MFSha]|uniref:hypothetical protein n=1 Tax=Dyella sp. 333MFSha TaxID=1798240 RepID=UPI00087E5175|nr:hypothetical protein [Dyella sp. 333MFSha]SDH00703.1 hypothetical protein SAMN04515659_3946 [Dyella sp. 333MFSha]
MWRNYLYRRCAVLACIGIACTGGAAAAAPAEKAPPPGFGAAVPADTLKAMSGGSNVTNNVSQQTLNGTMSDTEARDTVSGGNIVSGSAFGNAAGLPTVIQNSGNNVLIQNSTIVNVRMNP